MTESQLTLVNSLQSSLSAWPKMQNRFTLFLAVILLAACTQESPPRENPLVSADTTELGQWVLKWGHDTSRTQIIDSCSTYWARGAANEIPEEGVDICNGLSIELASVLSETGYGSIERSDVLLPTIWAAYKSARTIAEFTRPRLSPEQQAEADRAMKALGIPTE